MKFQDVPSWAILSGAPAEVRVRRVSAAEGSVARCENQHLALRPGCEGRGDKKGQERSEGQE